MSRSSPERWAAAAALALLLLGAGGAPAQDTTRAGPLSAEAARDLERQIDRAEGDTLAPNTELWEEYQRYGRSGGKARTSNERVEIGGSIVVGEDEEITGDVVAVGGRVEIYGQVNGDAVAVGGDVILRDGARVLGDAVSVGGRVREEGEATVLGERVSVNIGLPLGLPAWSLRCSAFPFDRPRWVSLFVDVLVLLVGLIGSFLLHAVAGRRLDVVSRRIDHEPGQSFLIGLLGALVTPVAVLVMSVLLAITLIGLLVVPVLLVLVLLVGFAGFAATALAVGRRMSASRAGEEALGPQRGPYYHLLIGYLALCVLFLLSSLLEFGLPVLGPFPFLLGVLGFFVLAFASILGYGALLSSRFGTQLPAAAAAGAAGATPPPPPPPPPPAPAEPPADPAAE